MLGRAFDGGFCRLIWNGIQTRRDYHNVVRLEDPDILVPLAAMAIIIFAVVFKVLNGIEPLRGPVRLPIAICVTILAVIGIDRAAMDFVINHYTALGVAILVGVAALIRNRFNQMQKRDKQ